MQGPNESNRDYLRRIKALGYNRIVLPNDPEYPALRAKAEMRKAEYEARLAGNRRKQDDLNFQGSQFGAAPNYGTPTVERMEELAAHLLKKLGREPETDEILELHDQLGDGPIPEV